VRFFTEDKSFSTGIPWDIPRVLYPLVETFWCQKVALAFKMCALMKKSIKERNEKMNTTSDKEDIKELSQQKGEPQTEVRIDCKPRGCTLRGGLY
jgi:hypothetical protein